MSPTHELTPRDYEAIDEALFATLIDSEDPAMELALSKVRRIIGQPIKGGADGVRTLLTECREIYAEAMGGSI